MRVKLWGTRGSVPSPGPETIRYGGNTSCVGVTLSDGSLLVLDAGTGIRGLAGALKAEGRDKSAKINLLFSHFHWDHICGFPFFLPIYQPGR